MSVFDDLSQKAKDLAEKGKEALGDKDSLIAKAKELYAEKDELLAKAKAGTEKFKEEAASLKEKASHVIEQGREAMHKKTDGNA